MVSYTEQYEKRKFHNEEFRIERHPEEQDKSCLILIKSPRMIFPYQKIDFLSNEKGFSIGTSIHLLTSLLSNNWCK